MTCGFSVSPVLQNISRRRQCSSNFDCQGLVSGHAVKPIRCQAHSEIRVASKGVGRPVAVGRRSIPEIPMVGKHRRTRGICLRRK